MPQFIKRPRKKAGAAPGTLVSVPASQQEKARIDVVCYGKESLAEQTVQTAGDALGLAGKADVTWIHISGGPDASLLSALGQGLGVHALTLEDIENTAHRPKVEAFDPYLFIALKHLGYDTETRHILGTQVSLLVFRDLLVSFQEKGQPLFGEVRERIRNGKGRIRNAKAGYLAYALVDAVVDHYYTALADMGDDIEDLEQRLLSDPDPSLLEEIHGLKREIIYFRKQAWPVREMLSRFMKAEYPLLPSSLDVYFSDVYDHIIHVMDTIESFRELIVSLLDLYLSSSGNRMNEIMGVLTIIATIFIPLTFLAGIYGMNFKYMPELEWRWGYFALLGIMAVLGLVMVVYFKKKKWL